MAKEFSAKVPDEEYERFVRNTGGTYGASTWFINTALKEFNERMDQYPSMGEHVKDSIASFLAERKEAART